MKTRLIFGGILMAALTCSTTAWAQAIGGGVKVGVNSATVSNINDPGQTTSQRVGFVGGGFLTFTLAPMIAFQPEVLYSMQGAKFTFSGSRGSGEATAKVDYVQVPLLLRLGPTGKDKASGYVIVGPTIGVLTQAKQVTTGRPDQDFKDDLKSADVGIAVGGGVTVSRFLVEARYTGGLRDVNKNKNSDGSTNKNRVFSVMAGVHF